jgi:hypothetical protein
VEIIEKKPGAEEEFRIQDSGARIRIRCLRLAIVLNSATLFADS